MDLTPECLGHGDHQSTLLGSMQVPKESPSYVVFERKSSRDRNDYTMVPYQTLELNVLLVMHCYAN